MAAKLWIFEVEHPDFEITRVVSIGPESATLAAAKEWGAVWGQIAAYCDVRRIGPAEKPRCRRCQKEFGSPGDVGGICPDCERADEIFNRERAERFRYARREGSLGARRAKW